MLREVTKPRMRRVGAECTAPELLLLLLMICKHFLIVKLTQYLQCAKCAHMAV